MKNTHLKFTRRTHGTKDANKLTAHSIRGTEINFCAARDTPIFCLNSSLNTTSKLNGFKYFHFMLCSLAMIAEQRAAHHIHVPERRIRQRAAFRFVRVENALWLRTLAHTAKETNRWRRYRGNIMRSVGTSATVANIALESRPTWRILKYREHSLSFCCYSFGSGGECCTSEICGTQADCVGRSISEVFFSFDYSLRANFSCTNSGFRFCFYKNFIRIYNSWISRKINRRDVAHWKNIRSHVVREKGKNAKNVHPGADRMPAGRANTFWNNLNVFICVLIRIHWQ